MALESCPSITSTIDTDTGQKWAAVDRNAGPASTRIPRNNLVGITSNSVLDYVRRRVTLALVPSPTEHALEQLHVLRATLATTDLPLDDTLDVRDRAELLRSYAQSARLGLDVSNQAIELKIRAERHAGALLRDLLGARKALPNRTLTDAGVTAMQSHSWQLISQIPEPEFDTRIESTKRAGRQLSSAAFVRAARQYLRQPGQGGNGQLSPTLRRLRQALELLREVRVISTQREVDLARAIVSLGEQWAVVLEPPMTRVTGGARETTCLLCGRPRPPSKPPRCTTCGGHWYQ